MERRFSVWGGGPLFCKEDSAWMRPSVQGGGPLCGQEALCVGSRPSVWGEIPLCRECCDGSYFAFS